MRKTTSLILMLTLIISSTALIFSGCSSEENGTLNLYTWEGMFSEDIISSFEKDTGIKVNYVNFDTDETMYSKLEAADGGDYDLVIADDYIIENVISSDLAQKIDKDKIKNYSNINPAYQGQFFDPNDEYTVPFGSGIQTIVYDPERVDLEISGYSDLWDESLEGKIGVIANPRVINGMALKTIGESYNTNDVDTIKKAGEKLNELAPNVRLIKDEYIQDDLLSGEISAAIMYTSQATMAKIANPNLKVIFPSEGIGFGVMGMFIPKKAPNPDAAHKFIDYVFEAERGAKCFEFMGFYCTNLAAEEYISDEYKDFIILPEEFMENMEMIENIASEAEEAHMEVWTQFKNLCE